MIIPGDISSIKITRDYINEIHMLHDKYGLDNGASSGCEDIDYLFLIYYILMNTPKHIVEYGSGYTTWLIYNIIKDYDLDTKFESYENLENYYYFTKKNLDIPTDIIKLVDVEVYDSYKLGSYDISPCKYIHDYKGYADVDFVIIDGPGPFQNYNPNVTLNYEEIVRCTGNRKPPLWIDSRQTTRHYYTYKGFKDQFLHI